jgi:hypothetical protein
MKTTLELPDELFREVKATAARQGILMKQFIAQALEEKLAGYFRPPEPKPWMKLAGCAASDPEMIAELQRLEAIIEEEFEQIDEDDWK